MVKVWLKDGAIDKATSGNALLLAEKDTKKGASLKAGCSSRRASVDFVITYTEFKPTAPSTTLLFVNLNDMLNPS